MRENWLFLSVLQPGFGGGRYGDIDRSGKIAINPQFEYAGEFSDGRTHAGYADRFDYIDTEGRLEINLQCDRAGNSGTGWRRDERRK